MTVVSYHFKERTPKSNKEYFYTLTCISKITLYSKTELDLLSIPCFVKIKTVSERTD